MTHRDGFPRLSARCAWRGEAGHRAPRATPAAPGAESLGTPPPVARANRRRASESLAAVPHRLRLPSYPADRPHDLSHVRFQDSGQDFPSTVSAVPFFDCSRRT